MQFNFSSINTQYNQTDAIAAIAKENENSTNSNISAVYNSSALNLDAAVLSISNKGSAKINAMLSKSIQLRASSSDPLLTPSERQEVTKELHEIRREIEEIRSKDQEKKPINKTEEEKPSMKFNIEDAKKMLETSTKNILKHADECLQTQNVHRECVLQLL